MSAPSARARGRGAGERGRRGGDETPLERASSAAGAWVSERLRAWTPPKFLWRTTATSLLFGSVLFRLIRQPRRVNWEQTIQQIARVGPQTLGVSLLTSSFVGHGVYDSVL